MSDQREQPYRDQDDVFDDQPAAEPGTAAYLAELAEITRLADALDRAAHDLPADVNATEDPELAALIEAVATVEDPLADATEARSFRSFHYRSRAAIVHLLEQDLAPAAPARRVIPFHRRAFFAPVAAAAAAAAIAVVAFAGGLIDIPGTGSNGTQVAQNLTPRTTADELTRIAMALTDIQQRSERGETIPAPALREVAEGTARVASMISTAPDSVDRETVATYSDTARNTETVLQSARPDPDAEDALTVALLAAREGQVVASRYLEDPEDETEPTPTPTAEVTPTPEPTPTPTPEPTPDPDDESGDDPGDDTDTDAGPTPTPEAEADEAP